MYDDLVSLSPPGCAKHVDVHFPHGFHIVGEFAKPSIRQSLYMSTHGLVSSCLYLGDLLRGMLS